MLFFLPQWWVYMLLGLNALGKTLVAKAQDQQNGTFVVWRIILESSTFWARSLIKDATIVVEDTMMARNRLTLTSKRWREILHKIIAVVIRGQSFSGGLMEYALLQCGMRVHGRFFIDLGLIAVLASLDNYERHYCCQYFVAPVLSFGGKMWMLW